MIRKNPSGDLPQIHPDAFIDPTAILCGKVVVHANVFIGPYAVIRADEVNAAGQMDPIVIGAHSNIQDGVVIHSKSGAAVTIGERTSMAHRAIVHGPCTVGESAGVVLAPVLVQISTPCGVPRSSASAWDTAGASAANSANNTAIHTAQRRCSGSGQGRVACFMMRCRIFRITACHARRVRHGYRAHRGLRPRQPSPCLQSWKKA